MLIGVVASFDELRGDGTVRTDDGELWYFHCLSLVDGTRTIEAGTRVRAERAVGLLGRDEAQGVTVLGS